MVLHVERIYLGVEAMLHGGHCDDLALIYSLLARTKNGLTHLKNAFAAYIKVSGWEQEIVMLTRGIERKRQLRSLVGSMIE